MKTLEYTYVDKTTWDRGAWDQEPDKIQWLARQIKNPELWIKQQ